MAAARREGPAPGRAVSEDAGRGDLWGDIPIMQTDLGMGSAERVVESLVRVESGGGILMVGLGR